MEIFIGLNIKHLIKTNSLTEESFGGLFGVGQGVINTYVRGRSFPKPEMIQNICRHFNISIDDFFNVDLSKKEYSPNNQSPKVLESEEHYESKSKIIAAQEKTIVTLEKQVALHEKHAVVQEKLIESLEDKIARAS